MKIDELIENHPLIFFFLLLLGFIGAGFLIYLDRRKKNEKY